MFRTLSIVAALGLAAASSAEAKTCRDAAGKFAACPAPAAAPVAKGCRDALGHFAKCGPAQAGPPAAARSGGIIGMARSLPPAASSAAMSGRPAAATAPAGSPTAKCKDGSLSYSKHRSGTCAGHKGVATWY